MRKARGAASAQRIHQLERQLTELIEQRSIELAAAKAAYEAERQIADRVESMLRRWCAPGQEKSNAGDALSDTEKRAILTRVAERRIEKARTPAIEAAYMAVLFDAHVIQRVGRQSSVEAHALDYSPRPAARNGLDAPLNSNGRNQIG